MKHLDSAILRQSKAEGFELLEIMNVLQYQFPDAGPITWFGMDDNYEEFDYDNWAKVQEKNPNQSPVSKTDFIVYDIVNINVL